GGGAKSSFSLLSGGGGRASANCWAVGRYRELVQHHTVELNEALHWEGRTWGGVHTPDPGGTAPKDGDAPIDIRCPAPHSCIAVGLTSKSGKSGGPAMTGLNEVLRWNGRNWHTAAVPSPGGPASGGGFSELLSLTCTSSHNCYAAGDYGSLG